MKKELILICAALALAGCNRQASNEGGTSSDYNAGTGSSSSLSTNSNSGGVGTGSSANSGAGSNTISTNSTGRTPGTSPK